MYPPGFQVSTTGLFDVQLTALGPDASLVIDPPRGDHKMQVYVARVAVRRSGVNRPRYGRSMATAQHPRLALSDADVNGETKLSGQRHLTGARHLGALTSSGSVLGPIHSTPVEIWSDAPIRQNIWCLGAVASDAQSIVHALCGTTASRP